ncbi:MAG TPA: putative ABC transporter permease [Bacillales bacterium]|nr:putative ABC transporter permease [Bacillales bacterium]
MSLLNSLEFHNPNIYFIDSLAAFIFYFTVYSFLGWLLENSYNLFTKRVFFKDNFLLGPFKPMYGFAPVILVYFMGLEPNWLVVILLCFFVPSIVEFISGYLLKKFFHREWWDYSDMPLHLKGYVCLPFSLCWIFLSFISLKWIHPFIVSVYGMIGGFWDKIYLAVILYYLIELFFAIRRNVFSGEKSTNPV